MNAKRISIILGAVLLICLGLLSITSGTRYRANSMVIAKPYTNTLFARSFESHIIQTIPTVLMVNVGPTFSTRPGSGVPLLTNGVSIRIAAIGSSPEDAKNSANEAARSICQIISTNYGVAGEVAESAYGARKYSYFHDSLQPAIGRWFKH